MLHAPTVLRSPHGITGYLTGQVLYHSLSLAPMLLGIFFPLQSIAVGLGQAVAQVFPMYWLGLGMRAAFLPEAATAIEVGGSWRTSDRGHR